MRLINADALKEKAWDADTRCGYVQVVDVGDIDDAPTIEPEKKTGRCILTGKGKTRMFIGNTYACSECGWETIGKVNYCPCCGVRMEDNK